MFAEALPKGCPPEEATTVTHFTVYRLVESASPAETDFASHALRWPEKYGKKCREHAVSVFSEQGSLARLLEMPVHAKKKMARLTLVPESGRVQQTGKDVTHYSWWRYAAFDAVAACEVES